MTGERKQLAQVFLGTASAQHPTSNARGPTKHLDTAYGIQVKTGSPPQSFIDEKELQCSIRFLESVHFARIAALLRCSSCDAVGDIRHGTDSPRRDRSAPMDWGYRCQYHWCDHCTAKRWIVSVHNNGRNWYHCAGHHRYRQSLFQLRDTDQSAIPIRVVQPNLQ